MEPITLPTALLFRTGDDILLNSKTLKTPGSSVHNMRNLLAVGYMCYAFYSYERLSRIVRGK